MAEVVFDPAYYFKNKAAQLNTLNDGQGYGENGALWTPKLVEQYFADHGIDAEKHFIFTGQIEGIDPALDFDVTAYFEAKVKQLNVMEGGIGYMGQQWTVESVAQHFSKHGISALDHYNSTGVNEGLDFTLEHMPQSEFTFADGDKAFIMSIDGLTAEDFVDDIYSDPAIIDAEKSTDHHDDNMCWAATASNMLTWIGWGEQGLGATAAASEPNGEDVVFDYFKESFLYGETLGGNQIYGIGWFADGSYTPRDESLEGDCDMPKEDTGDKLGFSADLYLDRVDFIETGVTGMEGITAALQSGDAVGLEVMWYRSLSDEQNLGGHAITCWGYTYDDTKAKDSVDYYTGLIVSDSDNDAGYADARDARDSMKIMELSWSTEKGAYYIAPEKYPSGAYGVLEGATFLSAEPGDQPVPDEDVDIIGSTVPVDIVLA